MKILACDEITIISSQVYECTNQHIVDYVPPQTFEDFDPVFLLELMSLGFSTVAGILVMPLLFKWAAKELLSALDYFR